MKKFVTVFITLLTVFSAAGCAATTPSTDANVSPSISSTSTPDVTVTPSPTPTLTPEPTTATVSEEIEALGEYTIVYPEHYEAPRQMREVELLRDVIEKLSGKRPDAVSDKTSSITGKNSIIFASSSVKTEFDEKVAGLESEMDYVICVDSDKNIILGGKSYYSDMRAAYDFINNYLGYDDVEDVYGEPAKDIGGEFVYKYEAPTFIIAAHNAFNELFTVEAVRDAKNAHFNLLTLYNLYGAAQFFTEENCKDVATWCVRYEMYFMTSSPADFTTHEVTVPCEEFLAKNPMVYGIYLYDEPGTDLIPTMHILAENFKEKYSKYGWKCYVNHFPFHDVWDLLNDSDYLSNTQITGLDKYMKNYSITDEEWLDYIALLEKAKIASEKNGQDLWFYHESRDKDKHGDAVYTHKVYRFAGYIAMCFGAEGINYFCYADATNLLQIVPDETWCYNECLVNKDFTPKENWYDAQEANAEIEKMSKLYVQYENTGAYLVGGSFNKEDAGFDDVFENMLDKTGNEITSQKYLVGHFDKKTGDGNAYIIMNLEEFNIQNYNIGKGQLIKLKINGENVVFYQNGEQVAATLNDEGYYEIRLCNGGCLFVTVD